MVESAPAVLEGLLRAFLADYLRIVEPDFAPGFELDRIALRKTPLAGAGVAASVPDRNGGEAVTVLALIEPYVLTPRECSARISRCLKELRLTYGHPVLASVVFLRGGWGVHLEGGPLLKICGIDLSWIYFSTVGLAQMRAEGYLQRPEPLAWTLAALMRPTERDLEEHRRACLERIASAPLDEERRALLRQGVAAFLDEDAPRAPAQRPDGPARRSGEPGSRAGRAGSKSGRLRTVTGHPPRNPDGSARTPDDLARSPGDRVREPNGSVRSPDGSAR